MQLHLGKVYRLRDGTVLGPFKLWPIADFENHFTTDLGSHCWHPETGKETSGYEHLDIVSEVYVTPAIILFNEE